MGQKGYHNHTMVKSDAGELMALRTSFWLPVMFSALFLIFDMYHVYTQVNCSKQDMNAILSLYGFALLRAINSYFPSTLLAFAVFAVFQQGIYRVSAGVPQWKLGGLMYGAVAYLALYAVYIAQGGTEALLSVAMTVFTVVFGFSIWLSLDEAVRKAPAAWRSAIG